MAGQPAIPAAKAFAPYRMFTPDNAGSATPPDFGFGTAYVQGYKSLWLDAPAG